MAKTFSRQTLAAVAAVGLVVAGAPLAANAQQRPQQQHQQQQQRPQQSQQGSQQHGNQQHGNQSSDAQQHRPQQGQQQAHHAGRYRVTTTVNVRNGPGTNHRRVGQVRAGRVIEVDQVRNGWLHIRGQGWISAQYARRV